VVSAKLLTVVTISLTFFLAPHSNAGAQTLAQAPVEATQVTFPAGWNIVSNAGSPSVDGEILDGTDGPTYCPTSGASQYEAISPGAGMRGPACWAYFDAPTTETLHTRVGSPPRLFFLHAGRWAMVGNPDSFNPSRIGGADYSLLYNPAIADYQPSSILPPGQGGWVYSLGVPAGLPLAGAWITASSCRSPCTQPETPMPICMGAINGVVVCSETYNCNGLSIPVSELCR